MDKLHSLRGKALSLTLLFSVFAFPSFSLATPVLPKPALEHSARVCEKLNQADAAACHARVVTDSGGKAKSGGNPTGYGPSVFKTAYNLPTVTFASSSRPIIGIVDAYHNPNIYNDLSFYSNYYKIPVLPKCVGPVAGSSAACFAQVNQNGGTASFPATNAGWALEIALDVEVAHAVCPDCSIVLVEANSNFFSDLLIAEDMAATLGADVISNSWGGSESSGQLSYDSHFNKPGIAITVSSGDSGYGAEYPAASQYVTSVGGTTLNVDQFGNYISESVWSGSGSGCSAYEPKPVWQKDTACANRTVADVSAVANPSTGAAVYDTVRYQGQKGWFKVGGTSLSAPLIGAVYALANNFSSLTNPVQLPYSNASSLRDITSGSNGSCGGSYLCTAAVGYDGPSGLGSPNGATAF